MMFQTLREVIAKESGGDAGFTFTDQDGKIRKASSIDEARQMATGQVKMKP